MFGMRHFGSNCEDRHAVGVVGDLPLWENAVLERYAMPVFAQRGVVRRERAGGGVCL